MITIGSLFDGSGGFPLAGVINGAYPLWAAEVEPYPIAVTKSRFPEMIHLGDVSTICGRNIPPVDIVTFGSPCQDMSINGKRAGMKHNDKGDGETTRSGLFYEAIRIIKEMKEATNDRYPTFAVWENVPGAFSSQKGEDFRFVLQELTSACSKADISIPRPEKKWLNAGEIMRDGWSIAWRILDAQYWGVPQRRKRIYLVADFRGERAGKILFERSGLQRDTSSSRKTRTASSENAGTSIEGSDKHKLIAPNYESQKEVYAMHDKATRFNGGGETRNNDGSGNGLGVTINGPMYTLTSADRHIISFSKAVIFEPKSALDENWTERNVKNALRAEASKSSHVICIEGDGNINASITEDFSPTLKARHENTVRHAAYENQQRKYIVRRLTPLECSRLQGFPDGWGKPYRKDDMSEDEISFWESVWKKHSEITGKAYKPCKNRAAAIKKYNGLHTDGAEYKMWGNGIALPNACFVVGGCIEELELQEE